MKSANLHVQNLSLAYDEKVLFTDLNLNISAGQWVALLGPSGVGKSSLIRLIAGLISNNQIKGQVRVDNDTSVLQHIAYMAQSDLLLPWLTIVDNIQLSLKLRKQTPQQRIVLKQKAADLLKQTGLSQASHLYPYQLSGGMRQRAALVRTFLENKPIVLMDEPFSALDTITRYKLQTLAATLLQGKTVLFITHDPLEALRLANQIYIMQNKPAEIRLVANLTSSMPREPTDAEVLKWQALLFQALTQMSNEP